MSGGLYPKCAVFDDFIVDTIAHCIRTDANGIEPALLPMAVAKGQGGDEPDGRSLLVCDDGPGPHSPTFEQVSTERFGEFCAVAGVRPFAHSRFSGGELALHPFSLDAQAKLIEPPANQLSVHCWMHRHRTGAAA